METVLAIPLFLALIGGVMWVGDLMVTRQQCLIADRYAAWNYGCRHEPGGYDAGTIHARFFESSEYRRPQDVRTEKEVFKWTHGARAGVRLKMRMPEWTQYMFNGATVILGAEPIEPDVELTGRSFAGRHSVLMRTRDGAQPGYIRNRYDIPGCGEVAKKWRDLYQEPWPYE
jgi:hypothetical protein